MLLNRKGKDSTLPRKLQRIWNIHNILKCSSDVTLVSFLNHKIIYYLLTYFKWGFRAGEIDPQVRHFPCKPDDLSFYCWWRELTPERCCLASTCALWHVWTYPYMYMHTPGSAFSRWTDCPGLDSAPPGACVEGAQCLLFHSGHSLAWNSFVDH